MKIGINTPAYNFKYDISDMAHRAEELGFESIWFPEHTVMPVGAKTPYPGTEDGHIPDSMNYMIDPFMGLAAASSVTKNLLLGTGVCLVPEHNPLNLAKTIATLDYFSGGRVLFGVGTGWLEEESEIMGVNFRRRWSQTREALADYLSSKKINKPFLIRVNPLTSKEGQKDLSLLSLLGENFIGLLIPKIENKPELEALPESLEVVALIETPLAIKNLESISSDVRIRGIALGGLDLSAELGSDMNWDSLIYSRSKIVLHAAINGVYSIDSPFVQINNMEQLEEESQKAKSLGFNSKFAIHPNQIEVIKRNFLPSDEEIEEAKKILKAYSNSDGGVIELDGKMVDEPIVKLMRKKLILAGLDPDN